MSRSKQLRDEITAALATGSSHPAATVSDWKKRVADIQRSARMTRDPAQRAILQRQLDAASDGLRAAQRSAANQPTYVTGLNLFALKELVLRYGPVFPRRLPPVDVPHVKRTLEAGLVELSGGAAQLTRAGRAAVADAIVQDIDRESRWQPRENLSVPVEKRAELLARDIAEHEAKVARLETALAKLTE